MEARPAAFAAGVSRLAICRLWRLSSTRVRPGVRWRVDLKIGRKWPASRRAMAAPCGPQESFCWPRRAGKVRLHARQRPTRPGAGTGGLTWQWKLARATPQLHCQERLSAQPPTGLQWAPSPQVVDDRRAEGQGELVAWLCQQDAAGRTSSGPPGIELCNCSILNNYEPIRGKCQLKVCEWRSE